MTTTERQHLETVLDQISQKAERQTDIMVLKMVAIIGLGLILAMALGGCSGPKNICNKIHDKRYYVGY